MPRRDDSVHFRTFGLSCHECGHATSYWSAGVSWPCGCGLAGGTRTREDVQRDIRRVEREVEHVPAPLIKPNPRGVAGEKVPRPLPVERRAHQPTDADALWRMMHELVGAG